MDCLAFTASRSIEVCRQMNRWPLSGSRWVALDGGFVGASCPGTPDRVAAAHDQSQSFRSATANVWFGQKLSMERSEADRQEGALKSIV